MVIACFGQTRAASSHFARSASGGSSCEHVQEVVVAHLEHLGRDAHAQRVALTLVEVDDDLESPWLPPCADAVRTVLARSHRISRSRRARPTSIAADSAARRRSHAAPTSPIHRAASANGPGVSRYTTRRPSRVPSAEPGGLEHREVLHDGLARHRQLRRDLPAVAGASPSRSTTRQRVGSESAAKTRSGVGAGKRTSGSPRPRRPSRSNRVSRTRSRVTSPTPDELERRSRRTTGRRRRRPAPTRTPGCGRASTSSTTPTRSPSGPWRAAAAGLARSSSTSSPSSAGSDLPHLVGRRGQLDDPRSTAGVVGATHGLHITRASPTTTALPVAVRPRPD